MKILRFLFIFFMISAITLSCNRIKNVFKTDNPREKYVHEINQSPIAQNELVQRWLSESDSVLSNPVTTDIPLQTKMVYFNNEPNAWAWRFRLSEGRTVRAHVSQSDTSHQLFMELFSIENGQRSLEQASADSMITHTLDEDQTLVLRVQPELLVSGSTTLTLTDNPSMEFPVQGAIRADIGSFWGDPRDGGSRRHEGVDIFADRGTPVLAAADGRVSRTGNGGLGGKTVWLRANGKAMYYAHLDSINTHRGEGVESGDTLGFVGNTGNARTTPPHLHFGIYDRGATNPLPYIDFANTQIEAVSADPTAFSKWGRIAAPKANVRPLPSTDEAPVTSLSRNNPVQILGGVGEWYQVQLPAGQRGFIYQSLVEPTHSRIGTRALTGADSLFTAYRTSHPLFLADSAETINIFGSYDNKQLARYNNQWLWLRSKE